MAAQDDYEPSLDDRRDFQDAERGFISALKPGVIKNTQGRVVWDIDAFDFMQDQPCPPSAHPHLWRQGQLNSKQGLFEVVPGIYQIRALDLSNMTIVEGDSGIIIIDPLISCECAAAGLGLYRAHRGDSRPVTGLIYSHSHGDHYMGAGGVISAEDGANIDIPIFAPEGFIEAVMSESVIAGPAMRKRGAFMYGNALPRGPTGQIGTGLGMASSTGTTSLIPPNLLIQKTGEEHVIDGVRIVFQMVPGTEAPAEINFHFPDFRALCIPETATNCMHNIVTLRGAQVRDAQAWSGYLDEAVVLFGATSDVLFGSHNWPSWGQAELVNRLEEQRDMYGYLHDQTVRMMNTGLTGIEIAEKIRMPPAISRAWHCRGFYGSVSHNVKGIYQKYMTWFDGNPASLWRYPPREEGQRYVDCLGGVEALCDKARHFLNQGDQRFAATLLGHALAAAPDDLESPARPLLAEAYERLGFGAENATWRNFYLSAAQELRTGKKVGMVVGGATPLGPNLSVEQWLEILSVQLDGERAAHKAPFSIDLDITDTQQKWRLIVKNGVLTRRLLQPETVLPISQASPDLALKLSRGQLLQLLRRLLKVEDLEDSQGRHEVLYDLMDLVAVQQDSARGPSQI